MDQPTGNPQTPTPRRTWADRQAASRASRRPWRMARRTVVVGSLALGPGLLLGLGLFYLGSSRGLDAWRLAETLLFFALAIAVAVTLLGLFFAWFTDDGRLLAALVGLVAGASLTTTVSLALIPGTTTDGSATFTSSREAASAQRTYVTCAWEDGEVVEVRTRGHVGWSEPPVREVAAVRLDLRASTVAIAVAEVGSTPVPRETLQATIRQADPTGRTGSAGFTGWQVTWSCPQNP
jgi:hypothetical protein